MKTSTILWILLIIIIIVGLGWWWTAKAPRAAPAALQSDAPAAEQSTAPAGTDQGMVDTGVSPNATVAYNGSAFSPASVTISVGGSVTWEDTSGQMWVASAVHPTHTVYDSTSRAEHCATGYAGPVPFDQCAPGASYTFTFTQAGTWHYHDHLNAGAVGTVVVQ